MQWADIVTKDLKIDRDWREIAQDCDEGNAIVETKVGEPNVKPEELEKVRKDERKKGKQIRLWRHSQSHCREAGCGFYAPEQGRPCQPSEAEARSCSSGGNDMPAL